MRPLAIALPVLGVLLATVPAASALGECVQEGGYRVCPVLYTEFGTRAGVEVYGDDGTYAEATASQGTGFFGDYLYVIAIVDVPGLARAHGGFGATDRSFNGIYENYCVCGALQTTELYVPFGVGLEDTTGDDMPDNVYVEPQL